MLDHAPTGHDAAAPTRRTLLRATAGLVVSFALARPASAQPMPAGHVETPAGTGAAPGAAAAGKTVALDQVDGFLAINPDNTVTLYSGKVDLGTGVRTALMQIVADELDVPPGQITVVSGDTALTPDQGPSFGSLSIQSGGVQIRQAAATARHALLDLAAAKLQAVPTALAVSEGRVTAGQESVTYAELVAGRALSLKVDPALPTRNPETFKVVGTSVARVDIPAKCTGTFTYMQDFRVDGMLHGRVVRPPTMGATLTGVDEASVKDIPGVVKIVRDGSFLGVVTKSEWAAIRASRALKAQWTDWAGLPDQDHLFEHVRATKVDKDEVTSSTGDAGLATDKASKRMSATYDFAIHTHGSIGPSCAVAQVVDGHLTCWTASQATHNLRKSLAAMTGLAADNVRCIYVDGSGCYGRNGHEDAASDAVLLSQGVGGQPVRVQWMRADEHGWDPKGPPTLLDMHAALDESGKVTAWQSELFTPDVTAKNVPLLTASLADKPHDAGMSPGGVTGDSAIPYSFENVHTIAHRLADTPFRPSWIRTPGRLQNTFANESFIDEIAAATRTDPMQFRIDHLKDPRGLELLQRLVKLSNWDSRPSPRTDQTGEVARGRGMAYVKYEMVRTYIGLVAEVEVTRATGAIRVTKVYVAHDCGQIINPDGLRNQIEGNVIQTTSRVLMENVTFDRGMVTSLDWSTYPIITFPDVPEVVMDLIDRPTEKPWGAGEPSSAVVPGAISNAVFDAVGARMRSVPMTPAKVLAAMKQA
ncbi:MAG: molybdopterin cofactor-binding domain-containing protein [Janthinobacterium lividum]